MKKILYTLILASMLFVLAACTASKTITVTNNGTEEYCELYASKASAQDWGENALKDGATVAIGSTFDIPVAEAGDYEVRVVTCGGIEQTLPVSVP